MGSLATKLVTCGMISSNIRQNFEALMIELPIILFVPHGTAAVDGGKRTVVIQANSMSSHLDFHFVKSKPLRLKLAVA